MAGSSGSRPVARIQTLNTGFIGSPPGGARAAEIALDLDGPEFDRPLALVVGAHRIGHEGQDAGFHLLLRRQVLWQRDLRHRGGVLETGLGDVERHRHVEDRPAVLDRDDAPRAEAAPLAAAVDAVDDRHLGIATKQEVGVERMGMEGLHVHGPAGCDERLADHLAAEHALPADLRAAAAKQVVLKLFEVEDGEKIVDGARHGSSGMTRAVWNRTRDAGLGAVLVSRTHRARPAPCWRSPPGDGSRTSHAARPSPETAIAAAAV